MAHLEDLSSAFTIRSRDDGGVQVLEARRLEKLVRGKRQGTPHPHGSANLHPAALNPGQHADKSREPKETTAPVAEGLVLCTLLGSKHYTIQSCDFQWSL